MGTRREGQAEQSTVVPLCWQWLHEKLNPVLCSQINMHLFTTQEEQGGSLLPQLENGCFISLGSETLFYIVFLCMLPESEVVVAWWGGNKRARSEATPSSSRTLHQTWPWLIADLSRQCRDGMLTSPVHPERQLWSQEHPGMGPCLSILLPKFSRSSNPLASPGIVH